MVDELIQGGLKLGEVDVAAGQVLLEDVEFGIGQHRRLPRQFVTLAVLSGYIQGDLSPCLELGGSQMIQKLAPSERTWTASELRKLTPQERDEILAAAAELAEEEYRTNRDLTDFEAFGEDDLYGHSTAAG